MDTDSSVAEVPEPQYCSYCDGGLCCALQFGYTGTMACGRSQQPPLARMLRLTCWFVSALVLGACHNHGHEAGGHDDHGDHGDHDDHDDHGHDPGATVKITAWSNEYELFAEHSPVVAGQAASMLAHFTVLTNFAALNAGPVTLQLNGPERVVATADQPLRPGIYEIEFVAPTPGSYTAQLVIAGASDGPPPSTIVLPPLVVTATVPPADEPPDPPGLITLLKEQQWAVPFATAFAHEGALTPTVELAAEISAPPDGLAEVGATVNGRFDGYRNTLPRPGQVVRKGQRLASIAATPTEPEAAAAAQLAVTQAKIELARAESLHTRSKQLLASDAIAPQEFEDAERALASAHAGVQAAGQASAFFRRAASGRGAGDFGIISPIDGVVAAVHARAGAAVSVGNPLITIVNPANLWVVVDVPEGTANSLSHDGALSVQLVGTTTWQNLGPTSARPLSISPLVDAQRRTVQVVYALPAGLANARVGGLAKVHVPTGAAAHGVTIDRSALIDDAGKKIVYVQVDGEHFVERTVRVEAVSGALALITAGLAPGERVVTQGAHIVRLTSRSTSEIPHGHLH